MQQISLLPVFAGVIPNKATQTDYDFANNIFGFLNYSGNTLIPYMNDTISDLNILSGEINTAASATATNAQTAQTAYQQAQTAIALLNAGAIDDTTIATNKAYSNQKINQLFSTLEAKKGANLPSAATVTIGTAGLGNTIYITGTTTITSLGVASVIGTRRTLIFDSALTLTHNGTFLICPNATNILTVAGTVVEVVAENTTVWRVLCVSHPSLSFAKLGYLSTITSDLQAQLNGKAATNQTMYLGTTAIPINRTTAAQTLTGISIDGSSASCTGNAASAGYLLGVTGSAPSYACRAWVNFNGTGTVAIRAGGNVSSITDNGVGNYAVNFTTAMADVNYSAASFGKRGEGTPIPDSTIGGYAISTTQLAVYTANGNGTYTDFSDVHIHIVR